MNHKPVRIKNYPTKYKLIDLINNTDLEEQRNDPVLNEWLNLPFLSDIDTMEACMSGPILQVPIASFEEFSAWVDDSFTFDIEQMKEALKGPYIRVPDYVCDKDFTDEDFDKWVMSL